MIEWRIVLIFCVLCGEIKSNSLEIPGGRYLPPNQQDLLAQASEDRLVSQTTVRGYPSDDGLIDQGEIITKNKNKPKPRTTQRPTIQETEQQIDAQGTKGVTNPTKGEGQSQGPGGQGSGGHDHEKGMPFEFEYGVNDERGNEHSHQQKSDGDIVKGEYKTQLPDGRTMIVKYNASWKSGFRITSIKYTKNNQNTQSTKNTINTKN